MEGRREVREEEESGGNAGGRGGEEGVDEQCRASFSFEERVSQAYFLRPPERERERPPPRPFERERDLEE